MTKARAIILCLFPAVAIAGLVTWGSGHLLAVTVRQAGNRRLAQLAVSPGRRAAASAITELRRRGPEGFRVLLAAHGEALDAVTRDDDWKRRREAVDQVARQRDAHVTGLYWHTSIEEALVAAAREGKPVLSLRLLGRLDEELSCANSRAFRTVLYPDPEVNQAMRSRFVLHWQSVRPVPKLTVDFGDGRKLVTTITGNSVHYVLAADGHPVDAVLGLNGPRSFAASLRQAEGAAGEYMALPEAERAGFLACHHQERLAELDRELAEDLGRLGEVAAITPPRIALGGGGGFTSYPEGTKNRVELPLLRALVPGVNGLSTTIDDATWSRIARLHPEASTLDARSRSVIEGKRSGGAAPADGASVEPMFERLRRSLAEETVRNEQVYHRQVHEWFAAGAIGPEAEELNERVYRELFLSPASDGWLGLVPPDAWNGLDRGGVVVDGGRS
jgi:hypothetical protein